MNSWLFVISAYAVAVALTVALLMWSYGSMRKAETAVEALKRK